jgi:mannose-6-phosphate isomerase-like protein (cupin superfamily)
LAIHVITGYGADGRSTVLSTEEKASFAAAGFDELTDDSVIQSRENKAIPSIAKLYESDTPGVCDRPAAGELLPIATPPHGALWLEMKFDGYYETEFHRTDSIDFHYIVGGEVELILEDGGVTLRAGDTAMLPSVLHRWRSEKSWHSNLFVIGLEPPRAGGA